MVWEIIALFMAGIALGFSIPLTVTVRRLKDDLIELYLKFSLLEQRSRETNSVCRHRDDGLRDRIDLLAKEIKQVRAAATPERIKAAEKIQTIIDRGTNDYRAAMKTSRSEYPLMALHQLIKNYQPSSGDWGWDEEYADLHRREPDKMRRLAANVEIFGFRNPVRLGDDGRVWDGHRRICAAVRLGLYWVPVERASDQKHNRGEQQVSFK